MVKLPIAHKVTTKTGIASEPIDVWGILCWVETFGIGANAFGKTHLWLIRHLQTIGHVACEADVENCCADTVVFNNVDHLTYQRPGLPQESTAWLQNQFQVRIAFVEAIQYVDQQLCVVVFTGHQMSASEVNPFQFREPFAKLLFDMSECALKGIGSAFTMAVAMETIYIFR